MNDDYTEAMAEAEALGLMSNGSPTRRAQCPTCFEVFSTDANFDRHLTPGRNADGFTGEWCRNPETAGLVKIGKAWQQPGPEQAILRSA